MVGWRVSSKCYLRSTFAHADSGGFGSPPLRKHKRYRLPVDEYAKRYKEKHGLAATLFEWGYIGSGPNFLSWALGVELVGSNITEAQSGYIHDKIIGEVEHGRDFELTLELWSGQRDWGKKAYN